jgi:hypothetical protein
MPDSLSLPVHLLERDQPIRRQIGQTGDFLPMTTGEFLDPYAGCCWRGTLDPSKTWNALKGERDVA